MGRFREGICIAGRLGEDMGINEFARKVCGAVEKKLGAGHTVELREIRKNNGVLLHGMMIQSKSRNVAPTIYLDSFWDAYETGTSFSAVVGRLLAIYWEGTPGNSIDIEFFRSYEAVKDRICYRLVGRKGNEALLEEVPHIEFLDLAICFYYAYCGKELGEGIILIHNSHMKMWDTSTSGLLGLAQSNTPRLFPWECSSMEDILNELTGREFGGESPSAQEGMGCQIPMKVLSNTKKLHGAACILYPDVLEGIAAAERSSLYVIPSSIHEVILLTDRGNSSPDALRNMIVEVNGTQVAPEEILSDNLYYYDFNEKKVEIVTK